MLSGSRAIWPNRKYGEILNMIFSCRWSSFCTGMSLIDPSLPIGQGMKMIASRFTRQVHGMMFFILSVLSVMAGTSPVGRVQSAMAWW